MVYWAIIALAAFLASCTQGTIEGEDLRGRPEPIALFQNALCLFLCNSAVQTSGVQSAVTGQGASGGTSTNTQSNTASATGGGVVK